MSFRLLFIVLQHTKIMHLDGDLEIDVITICVSLILGLQRHWQNQFSEKMEVNHGKPKYIFDSSTITFTRYRTVNH